MKILITGASGGLGQKLAEDSFARGHEIFLTDINEKALNAFASKWKAERNRVITSKLDISSAADWKKVMNLLYKKWERLDILMNVAGYLLPGYIYETQPKDIDRHIDINSKGLMYGTREASLRMIDQGGGHIINIASLAGVVPISGLTLYSASKFAVRGFSLAAAEELRPKNVFVTTVCPDAIKTPMLDLQKDYESASLTFSGNRYLAVEDVSNIIFQKVIPNKPLEILLPSSRGFLAKLVAFFPFLGIMLGPALRSKGKKKQAVYTV